MWILIAAIVLLGIFAAIASKIMRRRGAAPQAENSATDGECCGMHAVCEKDTLLAAAGKEIEYYDDYELDEYVNIPSSQYDDEALSRFEEVFYTLRAEDVPGWVRSLAMRQIEVPDKIKDEIIMIVEEERGKKNTRH